MARSQYQYQSVTGPVWTAAVAASLAWLPAGCAQPARTLPPNRLNDAVVEPFVEAIDTARELSWLASWPQPLAPERRRYDWSVLPPFQPPVGFDPATFPHVSTPILRIAPRGVVGDSVEPFTAALYRPDGLQWMPVGWGQPTRELRRSAPTWSLLSPLPIGPPFDPALLAWSPSSRPYPRAIAAGVLPERCVLIVPPLVLYDPARLYWLPYVPFPPRRLEAARLGLSVLDLKPPIPMVVAGPAPYGIVVGGSPDATISGGFDVIVSGPLDVDLT